MSFAAIRRQAERLAARLSTLRRADGPALTELSREPTLTLRAQGLKPDPWQADLLTSRSDRILLLAARQVGKSRATSALAVNDALLNAGATVLIVSPSERQSVEMLRKC